MFLGVFALPLESRLFRAFFNDPSVPMRINVTVGTDKARAWHGIWPLRLAAPAVAHVLSRVAASTPKIIYNGGVKFFVDDAFMALTMQLQWPGRVTDGIKGIWNSTPGGPLYRAMLPWWKAGCRIHVHSNGDAAQDATCEALAALQRTHPRFDHRFCFEHFGVSSESLVRRVKALGANVSINPYYPHLRGALNVAHLGVERAHTASRLKLALDAGLVVACHSDCPVAPPR